MTMDPKRWVGVDEHLGVPSLDRPDAPRSRWTLEAIAAVERPHDPVVSADGRHVAFILDRDTSDVWSVAVRGGPAVRLTTNRIPMPYWEDTPPSWSPDGSHLAYRLSGVVWIVPSAGGPARKLVAAGAPKWIDDRTLLVTVDRDDETRLAKLSVDDPWPIALTPRGQNVSGGKVAGDFAVYVNHRSEDFNSTEIWRVGLEGGAPEQLTGIPGMQDRGPAVSPDGRTLVFASERDGWYHLHALDLEERVTRRLTSEDADFSVAAWHESGEKLVAIRARRGRRDLVEVAAGDGEVRLIAEGGDWASPAWAGDSVIAVHEDHATPPRLVRVDPDGSVTALTGPPPAEIPVAPHVPFEEVVYPSLDGLEIHGFIFKPRQAGEHRVPAVVYPHGGPTSAYTDAWDGHAQYFIDKGYAWFAINFRGSTGYGRDFERANHGVWGVADTEDCLAAADYLSTLDWVDSSRIAIFGASYGSYMALASLAIDPKYRFACGVAKYGDSDIATSWATGDRGGREDLERMMLTPARARQAYDDGSPLWSAANIERPILVAHGEQDIRVHPDQSKQLVEELRRLGKTYEYVTYPTEGHGLLRAGPQVHFYRRLERFLDWHLM